MALAMPVYDLDKLMEETRRVAAEFRLTVGETLPVTPEIARYDAIRILGMSKADDDETGVDAYMHEDGEQIPCLIKGRVIFDESKGGRRIGSLNPDAPWRRILLVLLEADYSTQEIYALDKDVALEAGIDLANPRGAMTVAKFRSVGTLLWDRWNGASTGEVLDNRSP